MERFLLFVYKTSDPKGGMNDFISSYDSLLGAQYNAQFFFGKDDSLTLQIQDKDSNDNWTYDHDDVDWIHNSAEVTDPF